MTENCSVSKVIASKDCGYLILPMAPVSEYPSGVNVLTDPKHC